MESHYVIIIFVIVIFILLLLTYKNNDTYMCKRERKIYLINNKRYVNAKKKDLRVDINDKLEDRFDDQGKNAY